MVDLSVPEYIQKTLLKFGHCKLKIPRHSPYHAAAVNYGSKQQQQSQYDNTPPFSAKHIKLVQQVVGTLLLFGGATNPILNVPSVKSHPDKAKAQER